MTEKRFINDIDNGQLIDTKGELPTIDYSDKVDFYELWEFLNKLNDENEQLKEELGKFKEWEKHCRDVKREELDRVFKMSIYEIAEAFEYYKERIKKMERELEELDGYKPYSIKRAKKPYICFNREVLK